MSLLCFLCGGICLENIRIGRCYQSNGMFFCKEDKNMGNGRCLGAVWRCANIAIRK